MKTTEKFNGKAQNYAKYRSGYPKELFDFFMQAVELSAGDNVADVGAGTGIFSEMLLRQGLCVFAVEPNRDMLKEMRRNLGGYQNFIAVDGSAESTTLESHSVSLITAAQAFHWFHPQEFAQECRRIQKVGTKVALVWNQREYGSDFERKYRSLCMRFCPEYRGPSGGNEQTPEKLAAFFKGGVYLERCFENAIESDDESFKGRNLSSSYALQESDENYELFIQGQKELFDQYAVNGLLKLTNRTYLYLGEV